MSQQSDALAKFQRPFAIVTVVVTVFSLWPISTAAGNRDWAAVALLVALDVAMVVRWGSFARKRSSMAAQDERTGTDPEG